MVADTPQSHLHSLGEAGRPVAMAVWLFFVAALVFAMIIVGGATRLTDSGLSITEWKPLLGAIPPLSEVDWADAFEKYKQIPEYERVNAGMSLEDFKVIFWWEWGHRFLGRFIGLAFAVPLTLFWMTRSLVPGFKLRLVVILLLGGLQGFVGWYMVKSGLVDRVDVSQYRLAMHLSLAFVILSALIWIGLDVLDTRASHAPVPAPLPRWIVASAGAVVGLVFLQVVLGAFVAGTKAGLTYNTWPLMDGDFVPSGLAQLSPWYLNIFENITTIQFNHRMMAYLLLVAALFHAVWVSMGDGGRLVKVSAWIVGLCVVLQALIGIATLLAAQGEIPIGLGLLHQGGGAIVMGLAVWHLHTVWRLGRA